MKDGHCDSLDFRAYIKPVTKGYLLLIFEYFIIAYSRLFYALIYISFSKLAFSDVFYLFKYVRYFFYTSAYLDEGPYVRSIFT